MADNYYRNTTEENDLAQDDPFAELTRIMGHDPRSTAPMRPVAAESAGSLALELENELLGDVAGEMGPAIGDEDDAAGAEVISWQQELASEIPSASDPEFERTLEAVLDDIVDEEPPVPEQYAGFEEAAQDHGFDLRDEDLATLDPDFAPDEDPGSYGSHTLHYAQEEQDSFQREDAYGHEDTYAREDAAPYAQEDRGYAEAPQPEADIPFDYARASSARPEFLSAEPAQSFTESDSRAGEADTWAGVQFAAAVAQSTRESAATVRHGQALPPEIDTVEVPEKAVAMTEPLDVPEVSYREEAKPASELDEIEEILAGAFGETISNSDAGGDTWAETSPTLAEEPEPQHQDEIDDYFASVSMAGAGMAAAGPADFGSVAQRADESYVGGWDASGEEPARLAPEPAVAPPARQRSPLFGFRTAVAAGVVGGVALLGGTALYALSSGEDSGGPVVIAADDSPVKVRPENPGGIQIPNQDNQVYKRVSGEQAGDARPAQTQLVSATEEPIDLSAANNMPAPRTPSAQDDAAEMLPVAGENAGDTSAAKFDERLTNPMADDATRQDGVSLEPRRVRSLVVRPDGTMVPREVPEPNPTVANANAGANAGQGSETLTAENGTGAPGAQAATPAEGATQTPAVPQRGPIPPSRPANAVSTAQPQGETTQTPTQAPPQQVAALNTIPPAQAATSAASEWSVQIASQPTAEGAQQSYQQLAQRFGGMLQGRGVNIVKADIEGKGTYYRVRIPSSSKDDAIQLCTQLKAAGGSCFVSK